jgi:hypothetical protein
MTGDFAIIAEGYTDQVVLKNVIFGFFGEDNEPVVNFEQPLLDATSQSAGHAHGGWTLVRRYFEEKKFLQALQLNKYLVIHVDADIAEELGVPLVVNKKQRTPVELVEDVIVYFRGLIGDEIWSAHQARFLFAIGSDSIECWLLSLVFDRSKKAKRKKTTGCLEAMNNELRKKGRPPLSSGGSKDLKDPNEYRTLSESFEELSQIEEAAEYNPGFRRFVDQLKAIDAETRLRAEPASGPIR